MYCFLMVFVIFMSVLNFGGFVFSTLFWDKCIIHNFGKNTYNTKYMAKTNVFSDLWLMNLETLTVPCSAAVPSDHMAGGRELNSTTPAM